MSEVIVIKGVEYVKAPAVTEYSCEGCEFEHDDSGCAYAPDCLIGNGAIYKLAPTKEESEAFEKEFDVVAKQKQCACTQTAKVNPSNREQALIDAGDKMAELLRGYATSQHELDAIHDWIEVTKGE